MEQKMNIALNNDLIDNNFSELNFEWSKYGCYQEKVEKQSCKSPKTKEEFISAIKERVAYLKDNGYTIEILEIDEKVSRYFRVYSERSNEETYISKVLYLLSTDSVDSILHMIDNMCSYHYDKERKGYSNIDELKEILK